MNKKILMLLITVLAVAMLVTPVISKPTKGKKVAVTLYFSNQESEPIEIRETGNVEHRHGHVNWTLMLDFKNGTTLMGEAIDVQRYVLVVPQPNGNKIVFREQYEMWFPSAGGGFEGMANIQMDGIGNPPMIGRAHALLHGTGAFEGQTLNVGHPWAIFSPPIHWDGYLLKP
jgi:hypothetical protein